MDRTYDIAGFTLVLDKVTMISAIFEAENGEGWQFNVRLQCGTRIAVKRPDRSRAALDRDLLVRALGGG
ncbi:MAG: hypothetical protein R3323_10520 [Wenzhouxiangellaceae bacterium]|nr:hypothetical protein [Wenzhouxiangellaceae bacterium]